MIRRVRYRQLLAVVATLAVAGSSAAIVSAAGLAPLKKKSASAVQYLPKPGCGQHKRVGLAGLSGLRVGHKPKAPRRQDCPDLPERDDRERDD